MQGSASLIFQSPVFACLAGTGGIGTLSEHQRIDMRCVLVAEVSMGRSLHLS